MPSRARLLPSSTWEQARLDCLSRAPLDQHAWLIPGEAPRPSEAASTSYCLFAMETAAAGKSACGSLDDDVLATQNNCRFCQDSRVRPRLDFFTRSAGKGSISIVGTSATLKYSLECRDLFLRCLVDSYTILRPSPLKDSLVDS